ncbi:MAG TPA: hypothetical protein VIX73_32945 [Kofleriaceae bacterium]|jgi:hypothetical protein
MASTDESVGALASSTLLAAALRAASASAFATGDPRPSFYRIPARVERGVNMRTRSWLQANPRPCLPAISRGRRR